MHLRTREAPEYHRAWPESNTRSAPTLAKSQYSFLQHKGDIHSDQHLRDSRLGAEFSPNHARNSSSFTAYPTQRTARVCALPHTIGAESSRGITGSTEGLMSRIVLMAPYYLVVAMSTILVGQTSLRPSPSSSSPRRQTNFELVVSRMFFDSGRRVFVAHLTKRAPAAHAHQNAPNVCHKARSSWFGNCFVVS